MTTQFSSVGSRGRYVSQVAGESDGLATHGDLTQSASGRISRFSATLHVLLLVVVLFVLQFPQFMSSRQSTYVMLLLIACCWLSAPRTRGLLAPFGPLILLMAVSAMWAYTSKTALDSTLSTLVEIVGGTTVGSRLPLSLIVKVTNRGAVLVGLISLGLGVLVPSVGLQSGATGYAGTLQGFFISKNSLATVMLFGAIACLFQELPRASKRRSLLLSFSVYIPVLVWADSAAVIATLVLIVVFKLIYDWWRRASSESRTASVALALTPIVLGVAMSSAIYSGVLGALGRDTTLTGRTSIWQAAIQGWETRPWFGIGWGMFGTDPVLSQIQIGDYKWVRIHAHDGYLQVLTELGVVGAGLLAIALFRVIRGVIRTIRASPGAENGVLGAWLITFAINNITEQSMRLLPLFVVALIAAQCQRQLDRQNVGRPGSWAEAGTRRGPKSTSGAAQPPNARTVC